MTVLLLAAALLCWSPIEQSQAQLFVDVYPSQDDNGKTIWIFSGSSTTAHPSTSSIRSSGNYNTRDSMAIGSNNGDLYNANRPSNQLLNLSPLFSSTNTTDIDSIRKRIPGGGRTNITFAATATNTPTITIAGRGSRTIAKLFMTENALNLHGQPARDGWGIRIQAPNLLYGTGEASSWIGAGLIDKPIGDFFTGTFNNWTLTPDFASGSSQIRITVNSQIIPEPEEYALIFVLFALGFVLFHRHRQKKKRRQQAATS